MNNNPVFETFAVHVLVCCLITLIHHCSFFCVRSTEVRQNIKSIYSSQHNRKRFSDNLMGNKVKNTFQRFKNLKMKILARYQLSGSLNLTYIYVFKLLT